MKRLTVAFAALALGATAASAQVPGPDPLEIGVDAGISIGLGDNARTRIDIPAASARIGIPIAARTSLEPRFSLNVVTGNGDTRTDYLAELGLLYHLGSSRYPGAYHRAGMYARPFVGVIGFSGGGSDANAFLGAGVGYKMPIVSRLSSRFEANFAHHFGDGGSNALGLLAGLSFFTR